MTDLTPILEEAFRRAIPLAIAEMFYRHTALFFGEEVAAKVKAELLESIKEDEQRRYEWPDVVLEDALDAEVLI